MQNVSSPTGRGISSIGVRVQFILVSMLCVACPPGIAPCVAERSAQKPNPKLMKPEGITAARGSGTHHRGAGGASWGESYIRLDLLVHQKALGT